MKIKIDNSGFTVVEAVIILAVIALLAGTGVYAYKHRHDNAKKGVATTSQTGQSAATVTAKPGTTAAIDQVIQAESQSADSAYTSYEAQVQQSATSDNTSLNNLGGAYNASSL